MNMKVISYSLTGNNDALAASIASELGAEHIRIKEAKNRTNTNIALDIMLNRTPKLDAEIDRIDDEDMVLFVGPVWMGHVATPLRAYFKQLKGKHSRYGFISISGGADGDNPKLSRELKKRMGKKPLALIDMHIADLLPSEPKPTRKDTSSYKLTEKDVENLTDDILKKLRKNTAK